VRKNATILLLPHSQRNAGFALKMTDDRQKGEEMLNHQLSLVSSERGISVFRPQHF